MNNRIPTEDHKEFEINSVKLIEAKTRSFIGKAVTLGMLTVLVLVTAYGVLSHRQDIMSGIISSVNLIIAFVLGYYFKNRSG